MPTKKNATKGLKSKVTRRDKKIEKAEFVATERAKQLQKLGAHVYSPRLK